MHLLAGRVLGLTLGLGALAGCERGAQTHVPVGETRDVSPAEPSAAARAQVETLDLSACESARMPEHAEDPAVADRPREETHALARDAALRWRERASDPWMFCVDDPARFELVEREAWLCEGGPEQSEAWTIRGRGLELRLTFACAQPTHDGMPGGEIGAYLDEFWPYEPVPDWRMTLQTPSSSIDGEIRVRGLEGGMFEATIAAPIFAIYGHSATSACEPMADAGSDEGCYISIERHLVLGLTLRLPTIPAEIGTQ